MAIDSYIDIVYHHRITGDLNTALEINKQNLNLASEHLGEKHYLIADIYNEFGSAYYEKGDYDNAYENYQKMLILNLELFGNNHKNTARAYHNVGLIYYRRGDYEKGIDFFQKALAIWLNTIGEIQSSVATCYTNMANIYFAQQKFQKSIELDQKALAIWKETLGEDHPYISYSYNNLANTYQHLKNYDKALELNYKTLEIRFEQFGENHPDVGYSYSNIANVLNEKGKYDEAENLYFQALEIYSQRLDEVHPYISETYIGLGKLYFLKKDYAKSLQYYHKSLMSVIPAFTDSSVLINPPWDKALSWEHYLIGLNGKAKSFYNYYMKNGDVNNLRASVSTYQHLIAFMESLRSGFQRDGSKQFLSQQAFPIFEKAIQTALELYNVTNEFQALDLAFDFSEKSKAGILLDATFESNALKFAGIPDELLKKEKSLRTDLAYYETQHQLERQNDQPDISNIQKLEEELFELNQEYALLTNDFENKYPNYYELKYAHKSVSIDEIKNNLLDDQSALLEYTTGDSLLFLFLISPKNIYVKIIPLQNPINEQIKDFREALHNLDYDNYSKKAYELYQLLIEPIVKDLKNIDKLYIIPDGILNYLPFEALLTKKVNHSENIDFSNLDYLVKDFEISYHYSSALLFNLANPETFWPYLSSVHQQLMN